MSFHGFPCAPLHALKTWHTQAWEWIGQYARGIGRLGIAGRVITLGIEALLTISILSTALQRKTRSGREFANWDGGHVAPTAKTFNLSSLLRDAIAAADHLNNVLEGTAEADDPGLTSDRDSSPPAPLAEHSPSSPGTLRPTTIPTPCAILPTLTGDARRLARKKSQSKKNRRRERAESKASASFSHHQARPKTIQKYVTLDNSIETPATMADAKVTCTAYIGLNDKQTRDGRTYRLDELIGEGSEFNFTLVKYQKGIPTPIVSNDDEKYIIGVIADAPNDDSWPSLMATAAELLEDARNRCDFDEKDQDHRRGHFHILRCGVSHGGGQTMPGNLCNKMGNAKIAKELNKSEPFMRIASFTTAVMATWAPKMYNYYVDRLGLLHAEYPSLTRNFPSSVFEATTYNLGPKTACFRHRDFGNLLFGWCAVTALGDFDYTKGGHLVLWEANLVIEFPPGTTVLLPSAIISHSNVTIANNERRFSFTQYTAGGLFRWVDNHFQRTVDYKASLKGKARAAYLAEEKARWKFGLGLLSRLQELSSISK